MISASDSRKRARPKSSDEDTKQQQGDNCSFCRKSPAAVTVQVPVQHRKKRAATPFCLSCYYTTTVVRQDPEKYVSVFNQLQFDEQLPQLQALFSEVYVEVRKELEEESERAFQTQKSDPLAMLHQAPKRRPKALPGQNKKAGKQTDGGFLRDVPIPDRLLRTQQNQAQLQRAQIERMKRAAKQTEESDLYRRRKPSKKSIWNLAMETQTKAGSKPHEGFQHLLTDRAGVSCSCGSSNVRNFGNITSRNQDIKKGETWGMKDRGNEVVTKYKCNECGKAWQEED
jgi:hypothetical protein